MKNFGFILLAAVLLAGGAVYWLMFQGGAERMSANRIIARIEAYRERAGHLPDPDNNVLLQSLGFELWVGFHPEYRVVNSNDYVIVIVQGFEGPYWLYESKTKSWRQGYP